MRATWRAVFAVVCTMLVSLLGAAAAYGCAQVGPAVIGSDCSPPPPPQASPPPPQSNPSADGAADRFLSLTNGERSSRGFGTLAPEAELEAISLAHAIDMAQAGRIYHNSDIYSADFRAALGNPYVIGENVGRGQDVDSIHEAFMQSQSHRDNILRSQFTLAGMGVVSANGSLWVVEMFMSPPRGPEHPYAGRGGVAARAGVRRTRVGPDPAAWQWMSLGGPDDVDLGAGTAVLAETSTARTFTGGEDALPGVVAGVLVVLLVSVRRRWRRARRAF